MNFQDTLLDLMKQCDLNQRRLSQETGIPATTISGWFNARRLPDFYSLIRLSNFFDVSADYLLGLSKDEESPRIPSASNAALKSDEAELLELYRKLPYENKQRLIARAEVMLEDTAARNKRG